MNPDPHAVDYPLVTRQDRYLDGRSCVIAEYPDLPGCYAYGKDTEEAKALLRNAKTAYLNYLITKGHNIPMPSKLREREWQIGTLGNAATTIYDNVAHWITAKSSGRPTPPATPALT